MTFILTILIDLCLIFAVAKLHKRREAFVWDHHVATMRHLTIAIIRLRKEFDKKLNRLDGGRQGSIIKAKVAEKIAERALNIANAASLGVLAVQKSLQVPRLMTKNQVQRNQLAKDEVDKIFSDQGGFDFLRPVLSDEDNELLDKLEEHKAKNGGVI